jgi:hypothetical protein
VRRWAAVVVAGAFLAATSCASASGVSLPGCGRADDSVFALMAQAVPSATQLPCVKDLPVGWTFSGASIRDGEAQLWLDSTIAGVHAVEIALTGACDIGVAVEVPAAPDEVGMRTYVLPDLPPAFSGQRILLFQGGCVTYRYHFAGEAPPTLALEAEEALSFTARSEIVRQVSEELDQTLCGAGAPPCES